MLEIKEDIGAVVPTTLLVNAGDKYVRIDLSNDGYFGKPEHVTIVLTREQWAQIKREVDGDPRSDAKAAYDKAYEVSEAAYKSFEKNRTQLHWDVYRALAEEAHRLYMEWDEMKEDK